MIVERPKEIAYWPYNTDNGRVMPSSMGLGIILGGWTEENQYPVA